MTLKSLLLSCLLLPCFANSLSLEEKVGQILMVHFDGAEVNQNAKTLIEEVHVGSFIYYNWANELTSPDQVRNLSSGLQKLSKIPLLIAADQEGGIVTRLDKGFTIFPGNKALAMTGKPKFAEKCAFAMGQEMLAVGTNYNLAPVVDVNNNPQNPVIGIRSFGDSPEIVIAFGKEALAGYKKAGVITSLKHFPGHGDVSTDSHSDLPIVNKPLGELEKVELLPFAKLASQADTVMTAHLMVPALDPDHCSTLSKKTLDYLKNQLGFQGVIISDSLVMEGVLKQCGGSVDEAAIQAFNAGCDILCLGGRQLVAGGKKELTVADVKRIHRSLVDAVATKRISEDRLNEALTKIAKLKERIPQPTALEKIDWAKHQQLSKKIAMLAVKVDRYDRSIHDLSKKKVALFAPKLVQGSLAQTTMIKIGKETTPFYFESLNPSDQEIQKAIVEAQKSDLVVFCTLNAWKNPSQSKAVEMMLALGKPVIVTVLRDPTDANLFPQANMIISTFSSVPNSLEAAAIRIRSLTD